MSKKIDLERQSLSVLIVDKDPDDRRSMVRTLAQLSAEVSITECDSAQEAYEALLHGNYDIALITQELPDRQGTELLFQLKAESKLHTPIILLTETDDMGEEVIRLGATEFISKQSRSVQQLRKSIRYTLERHKLWEELQDSKAREQQERELRLLEESEASSSSSAITFKQSSFESKFLTLSSEYLRLFEVFSSDASYKRPAQSPAQIKEYATLLGMLGCGPKELVRIHREALSQLVQNKTRKREESLTNESRYMLLQLMGELLLYYRDR